MISSSKIPKITSKIKNVKINNKIIFNAKNIPIIAGPNGVESRKLIFNVAKFLKKRYKYFTRPRLQTVNLSI